MTDEPEESEPSDSWTMLCQKAMAMHGRVSPIQVSVETVISAPPCTGCLFWAPVVEPDSDVSWAKRREVVLCLCHAPNMVDDFSCFKERHAVKKTKLEKSAKKPLEEK